MSSQLTAIAKSHNLRPRIVPVRSGLLQRKCACGGGASLSGDCEECGKKQLQRQATSQSGRDTAPPMVRDVLNAPGHPLEEPTRSFMESRFGHDFSQVRVHTDARAAESAAAVNAQAYTVGHNVVFASGQYGPATTMGQLLIAHELAHVVQQQSAGAPVASGLEISAPHDQSELQAEQAATSAITGESVRVFPAVRARLHRQPAGSAPGKTPAPPAKAAGKGAKKFPVENCPFPSDFKDDHEAGSNMLCVADESFKKAPSCNLTDKHFELINVAKEAARKRVEKASSRMSWFGGPEYAQRIAGKVFKGAPPDTDTIKDTLNKMVKILNSKTLSFNGATCADPLCEGPKQHAAAYESGPTQPVTLCPRSFLPDYLPKLPRTIIHEAAHLAGIDIDPNIDESYCDGKGCGEPCQDAMSADAWALFIDCLGGALIMPPKPKPPVRLPVATPSFDKKTGESVEKEFGR
ncbi:MAG TPA: DUF4157 domain-containing protein [Pyrinomonadaceae bacterium]|nr:DUF4157 domain-containing protein [Pyrinomonadaceae bacterium]